ncbi:hypothetical protein GCM10018777_31760 [Streptomyces albogriseolus]|nr:hypothetical protein GCM10018777_31760 [Streptomyces viridodiastaticus]
MASGGGALGIKPGPGRCATPADRPFRSPVVGLTRQCQCAAVMFPALVPTGRVKRIDWDDRFSVAVSGKPFLDVRQASDAAGDRDDAVQRATAVETAVVREDA